MLLHAGNSGETVNENSEKAEKDFPSNFICSQQLLVLLKPNFKFNNTDS